MTDLKKYEKAFWFLLVAIVVFPGYYIIPFFQEATEGRALDTAFDRAIPFTSPWMFAYGGVYIGLLLPVFVVKCDALFRRTGMAYSFAMLVSFAVYIAMPVTTARFRMPIDSIDTASFWGWGAAFNYTYDPPINCFPSLHVAIVTLAALSTWRADPPVGYGGFLMAGLIAASTLFVKQHYIADVVAGFALAAVAYAAFLRGWERGERPEGEIRRHRAGVAMFLGLYAFAVLGILLPLYLMDVRPWKTGAGWSRPGVASVTSAQ